MADKELIPAVQSKPTRYDKKDKLHQNRDYSLKQWEIFAADVGPNEDTAKGPRCKRWVKTNLFLLLTFIGIGLGFLIGLTVRNAHPSTDVLIWIGMPGEVYMRILKAIILPLIICTVIDGTSNTDPGSNGRIGLVTFGYIIITNALGGILGLTLALVIKPGSITREEKNERSPDTRNLMVVDIFADFIRNLFPDNIVKATMKMSQTKYTNEDVVKEMNESGTLANITSTELTKSLGSVDGTNILGLIIISAAVGIAASQTGGRGRPLTLFFHAGVIITFKLFDWIKWTTPVGVASLIARALADIDDLQSAMTSMGLFVVTCSGGCLVYSLVILPIIFVIFIRKNPFRFLLNVARPAIMGFGPASLTIATPEMIRIGEETYNVDPRVASLSFPLCITLNRDGSCLFVAATCLFVAQYTDTSMDTGKVLTTAVLSILSSLAIPSVPSSSVVAILIILGSLGVPTTNIGLVMAVEWINDRVRTSTNVISGVLGVLLTWRLCKKTMLQKDLEMADSELSSKEMEVNSV